jgi:hypothetical protein
MNSEGYNEAKAILSAALRERAPATGEAIGEQSPLSYAENAVVFALANLLQLADGPVEEQPPMEERMKLQRAEFDAADNLANAIRAHGMTPVVDDDYPEVRQRYEDALREFLSACKANGRTMP